MKRFVSKTTSHACNAGHVMTWVPVCCRKESTSIGSPCTKKYNSASPIMGIICNGLNACCMQTRPLFLRTSGSSGVLKALLLERNGQLSFNPQKKNLGRSDVTVAKVAAPASDPSLRKLPRSIQFQGTSVSISISRSLQYKHEQRKAKEADTLGKQARRKAKKVKRQTGKHQSGQQHQAAASQAIQPELAVSQHAVEQQGVVLDDEPLLEADFPLLGSFKMPTIIGTPAALARLNPVVPLWFFRYMCVSQM